MIIKEIDIDGQNQKVIESWDGYLYNFRNDIDPGRGELHIQRLFTKLGGEDKIFVDVGANVGHYAMRMAKVYRKVIAIDANQDIIDDLKKNMELNLGKDNNVEVICKAVGINNDNGLDFYITSSSPGNTFISKQDSRDIKKIRNLRIYELDDLVDHCDVVKIDVEGWEENVICGMDRLLRECKPAMVIEHHENRGYPEINGSLVRIIKSLREYGYMNIDIDGYHWLHVHKDDLVNRIELYKDTIATYWMNKVTINLNVDLPWFYGLKGDWWYGLTIPEFFFDIHNHIGFGEEHEESLLEPFR